MLTLWIALIIGIAAIVDDLAYRRISNWIPLAALIAGFALQISLHGWKGVFMSAGGVAAGASAFLVFYLLGGMGGGDIKLMAGFGAMLGANGILAASLWTAGLGGIMAAVVILVNALRRSWARRIRPADQEPDRIRIGADSIPYAPVIAAGVWISLAAGA